MAFFRSSYRYNLGYALSGGGAKGFAHLGALKALETTGIKPDIIAGTSAGALAGVLYADGYHPDEIAELFRKKEFRQFAELSLPKAGLFKSSGLHHFLKQNLRAKTFEELQIPFLCVTTDWERARTVVFSEGAHLIESVVASCSIPIILHPEYIDNVPYVDGGLFKNFPVSVIRKECKYVIGINVATIIPYAEKSSLKKMAERAFNIMSNSNTLIDKKLCDILIETEGARKFTMFDMSHIEKIAGIGYESAVSVINEADSQRIIRRCLRYDELNKRVSGYIKQMKRR